LCDRILEILDFFEETVTVKLSGGLLASDLVQLVPQLGPALASSTGPLCGDTYFLAHGGLWRMRV